MTHTTKVTEKKATGNGDLSGYKAECTCGFVSTSMFCFDAERAAHDHIEYMEKKENKQVAK